MDASPLFDPQYLPVILGTLVGFGLLAAALLVPIYRFLDREQEVAEHWTPDELARRVREYEERQNENPESREDEPTGDAETVDHDEEAPHPTE